MKPLFRRTYAASPCRLDGVLAVIVRIQVTISKDGHP